MIHWLGFFCRPGIARAVPPDMTFGPAYAACAAKCRKFAAGHLIGCFAGMCQAIARAMPGHGLSAITRHSPGYLPGRTGK